MSYEGELMESCPAELFNWTKTYAVIVTGSEANPYGHMLLNVGGKGGQYFHVAGVVARPRMMDEKQFRHYMSASQKTIVTVTPVKIAEPAKAQMKLEDLLSKNWKWLGVVNNCETFVEEIVAAGGGPKLHRGVLALPMQSSNQCREW